MNPVTLVFGGFLGVWAASLAWAGGVTENGLPATAAALAALYLASLPALKEPARLSRPALLLLSLLAATFLLDLLPGPAFLHPVTHRLRVQHGLNPLAWPAGADTFYTVRVLAQACTYTLTALLILRLRQAGLSTSTLLSGLVAVISAEAAAGLVQQFGDFKSVPFYGPRSSPDSASGTFVSRNNFAGLMAIGLVLAVARAYGKFAWPSRGSGSTPTSASKPRWMRRVEGGWTWTLAAALFVVALVVSRSRGGALSAIGGLTLLPLFHRGRASLAGAAALLAVAALAVFVANPAGLLDRFSQMDPFDLGAEQRWTIFTTTVAAALHQPILGFGWGTHPRAYHPFQPPSLFGQIHHAHNEYVNVFFETGALGLALCLAALAFWYVRVWRAQKPLPGPDRMPVTAALAAVSVTLLHSLVDFDLRITGVGIAWAALLGLGAAAIRDGDARPTWPIAVVALLAAGACWQVPLEGSLGLAPYDHKAAWNAGEVEVAADLWPAEIHLQREAGLTLWERGDKAKANVCFKRLFETEPGAIDGVLDEVGVDGFEALLPETAAARAMYAGALVKRGRWQEAAEAFARGPVDAAGCDYFASTLETAGQWGLEASVRERRLGLKSDAWAHAASASAWLKLGVYDRALERARTASRVDPTNALWAARRAQILHAKGDRVAAVEAWTEACALAPAELEWRLGRGYTELAEKTYVAAAEDFKEVLKSRPDDRGATLALVQALEGQGQSASARILADEWLRKHPDDAGARALRDSLRK